uniref:SHRT_binder n=1 Tax=synthetic construct TaxID=32630 RepID=UPI003624AC8A
MSGGPKTVVVRLSPSMNEEQAAEIGREAGKAALAAGDRLVFVGPADQSYAAMKAAMEAGLPEVTMYALDFSDAESALKAAEVAEDEGDEEVAEVAREIAEEIKAGGSGSHHWGSTHHHHHH